MQSRFQFTFAVGIVAALTLGASSAAAQQPTTGTGSTTGSTMGTTGVQRDSATGTVSRDSSGLTRPTMPGNALDTTSVPAGASSGGSLRGTGTGPGTTGAGTGATTGTTVPPTTDTMGAGTGAGSSYGPSSAGSGAATSGSAVSGASTSGASTSGASSAQPRADRVRKDGTTTSSSGGEVAPEVSAPPAPAPAPAPAPVPEPAPAPSSDSSTTDSSGIVTSSSSGGEVEAQPALSTPRFGNGFYWGMHAGANFPQKRERHGHVQQRGRDALRDRRRRRPLVGPRPHVALRRGTLRARVHAGAGHRLGARLGGPDVPLIG